jgi:hypothetical protein
MSSIDWNGVGYKLSISSSDIEELDEKSSENPRIDRIGGKDIESRIP